MKILIIEQWLHHKNKIGFEIMLKYIQENNLISNLTYTFGTVRDLDKEVWNIVYSPATPINTLRYPNIKFIFGPHFSVFPNQMLQSINNQRKNALYIQPSEWVRDAWVKMNAEYFLPIKTLNFAVDTNRFKPESNKRNEIFVYFKRRKQDELNVLENFLRENRLQYKVFDYMKKYDENEYLKTLRNAKFGIILGATESQGFAIQEALSCDVPLLVWNSTSMLQEVGGNYPDLPATSIPYWNNKCGEVFYKWSEFKEKFDAILSGIKKNKYNPRQFVIDELSAKPCAERVVKLFLN